MKTCVAAALALAFFAGAALADTAAPAAPPTPRPNNRGAAFPMQGGQAIYEGVCQGCHMPEAVGAKGAGMYPALAKNAKLEAAGYPVSIILNGQKAMPSLGAYFSDTQIAEVVNYIRSHFGNHYTDKITAADVKMMR